MFYNQQTATTTQTCLINGESYCEMWENTEIKTFNWFDNILLFLIPLTIIFVISLFKQKK